MKKRLCIPLAFILTAVAVLCGYTSLVPDTSPPLSVSVSTTQSNENTVTVKASVLPSDNTALVDWSLSWVNPSSLWVLNKTVTDYVTVTPLSDGSQTAKVNCLQAFGEQITVNVKLRSNPEIQGVCKLDYLMREVLSYRYYLWPVDNRYRPSYNGYTLFEEGSVVSVNIEEEWANYKTGGDEYAYFYINDDILYTTGTVQPQYTDVSSDLMISTNSNFRSYMSQKGYTISSYTQLSFYNPSLLLDRKVCSLPLLVNALIPSSVNKNDSTALKNYLAIIAGYTGTVADLYAGITLDGELYEIRSGISFYMKTYALTADPPSYVF